MNVTGKGKTCKLCGYVERTAVKFVVVVEVSTPESGP